jgi:uncharacterized membrane protein YedE/YeeE
MTSFTPWAGLVGGALIGLSAALLLWLDGRIAGVSGIAGGLWYSVRGERAWRVLFVLGLILGTAAFEAASTHPTPLRSLFPVPVLLAAGFAVGYGTSMSHGCTSGHGVCGLARFSLRSLVATLTFLGTALLTTFVIRHVLHVL